MDTNQLVSSFSYHEMVLKEKKNLLSKFVSSELEDVSKSDSKSSGQLRICSDVQSWRLLSSILLAMIFLWFFDVPLLEIWTSDLGPTTEKVAQAVLEAEKLKNNRRCSCLSS